MSWWNPFSRSARIDPGEAIKSVLPTIMHIMRQVFAEAGEIAPDSALAQVGLIDGDQTVMGFLANGEPGIAFEHLLYMIREAGLPISPEIYDTIATIGIALWLPEKEWSDLRPTQ